MGREDHLHKELKIFYMCMYVRVNSQKYCLGLFPFQLTRGLGNWMTAVPGRTGGGAMIMTSQRW